jgi:hypothetical protein
MRLIKFVVNLFQFQRTNWRAVFLCFLAAALFWLFNTLSRPYAVNIAFPLQLSFDAERYAPASELPTQLTINVSGNGWDLLRHQLGMRIPQLTVPVERPAETRKLATSNLLPILANQLGGLTINFPVTDSIRFHIEARDRHRFKVAVVAEKLTFRGNLGRVSQIVALPDSIDIEGPTSLLHNLPDTILLVLPAKRVNENYRERLDIRLPNESLLVAQPPSVEVLFEVAEMRDITLRVPLRPAHATLPDSVSCQLWVPGNWLETLPEMTRLFYAELPVGSASEKVLPKLRGLPDLVTVIRVDSVSSNAPQL